MRDASKEGNPCNDENKGKYANMDDLIKALIVNQKEET